MTEVSWTVDSKDYSNVSVARLVATVLAVIPGGVVVMHDVANDRNTIAAIPGIAAGLRARMLCAARLVASSQGLPGWEHGLFDPDDAAHNSTVES